MRYLFENSRFVLVLMKHKLKVMNKVKNVVEIV